MAETFLTFIHIGDSHINVDANYTHRVKEPPYIRASALVDHINHLPFEVDFILHAGDVMQDPQSPDDYQHARFVFSNSKYPIYYLSGNHDIAEYLQTGLLNQDTSKPHKKHYYTVDVKGCQLVCLDSSVPHQPYGEIDASQLEWLNTICAAEDDRPLIVATHHHVLPMGTPWYDELCTRNGEVVHEVLRKAKHRLRAVFFGHVHQNMTMIRDQITYISVLSSWYQIRT